jgi:AAA+ superfamily predicted ATPase
MENFKGVLFCSTNLVKSLDPAVMRRFNQKIKFDYLEDFEKRELFNLMLGELMQEKLSQDDLRRLYQVKNLTPGDFKVVYQKNFF